MSNQDGTKLTISSPEKVARMLTRIGDSGIPLIIRAVSSPSVAIKGRAIPSTGNVIDLGLKIGNISEQGVKFLALHGKKGVTVEFVLTSSKVTFQSEIVLLGRQDCLVGIPQSLDSIERRKNIRFNVTPNARAFLALNNHHSEERDLLASPFWPSAIDFGQLVPVGDVSLGGISLVSSFPGLVKSLDRGQSIEKGLIYFPMSHGIEVEIAIRWSKKVKETAVEKDGISRTVRQYKFGLQFLNPSAELLTQIHILIQKISRHEAI
jgi:hypothetical protein